jgi:hypothetical protein
VEVDVIQRPSRRRRLLQTGTSVVTGKVTSKPGGPTTPEQALEDGINNNNVLNSIKSIDPSVTAVTLSSATPPRDSSSSGLSAGVTALIIALSVVVIVAVLVVVVYLYTRRSQASRAGSAFQPKRRGQGASSLPSVDIMNPTYQVGEVDYRPQYSYDYGGSPYQGRSFGQGQFSMDDDVNV